LSCSRTPTPTPTPEPTPDINVNPGHLDFECSVVVGGGNLNSLTQCSCFGSSDNNTISATETHGAKQSREDMEETINAIEEKDARWTAGETSVSDLTFEEKKMRCGIKSPPGLTILTTEERVRVVAPGVSVPIGTFNWRGRDGVPIDTFDWRDKDGSNWMTSVKDQGSCGSCAAFGTIGALEPLIRIDKNNPGMPIDLSEAHLFFCGGGTCYDGWRCGSACNYLENSGTPDEACFPYQPWDMPCSDTCSDWESRAWKITDWGLLASDPANLKAALHLSPLISVVYMGQDAFYYTGGIYEEVWSSNEWREAFQNQPNHGVTVVDTGL
jgi:hypothetical protein